MSIGTKIHNVLVAVDQAAGTILPGGLPDETISARSGRLQFAHPYTWGLLAKALNTISPGHTERAIVNDRLRAEKVAAIEKQAEKEGL